MIPLITRAVKGLLGLLAALAVCAPDAHGQYVETAGWKSSSGVATYDFSGIGTYLGGGTTYIPFGGSLGGFIPYSPGPGGGLGTFRGIREPGTRMSSSGMTMMGTRPPLGLIRNSITPLTPIGAGAMGNGSSRGMGAMEGLLPQTPSVGSMRGMSRPPVGNYPFRQPPSLLGPASSSPAMSM